MVKHNSEKLGRYIDVIDGVCRYAKLHKIDPGTYKPAKLVAEVLGDESLKKLDHKELSVSLTKTITRGLQALYCVYRDHGFTHVKAVTRVRCALMAHCDALLEEKKDQGKKTIESLFQDWDREETLEDNKK